LKVPAGKIGGAMRFIDNKLNNPLKLYDCFTDYDYEKIRNFGFNRIGVRGPRSQEILAQYGIPSTIVGDTALYLKPTEYNYEKNYKIAICIRDKGMKWEESKNYIKEIISFCNSLSDDYRFVILPIYPPDVKINKTISGKINNSKILDFSDNVNINGLLDEITTCDLMIGEKLHSNVLSACCHVPFISIEYDPKSTDFVKTLELEMLNIRIGRVSEEKLDSLFHEIINNDKILNKLKSNVEKLRTKLEEFAESIKQEIDTYNN
jgi:polysaccharide pyruvyl transferase WcaK-like protein